MTENTAVLAAYGLQKAYGSCMALDGAAMMVRRGDIYGLVGRNGAGKTTLLKLIQQECSPERGSVYVVPKAAIGLLDQNMAQIDYEKTVLENVMEDSVQNESIARTILARLLLSAQDIRKRRASSPAGSGSSWLSPGCSWAGPTC